MLPEALQSLVSTDRCLLLEVACGPDSVLTNTMRDITGDPKSAERCSLWNGCDLGTGKGVRTVLDKVDLLKPQHVWMSPVCGPYSIMQQANQRTESQRQDLEEKRRAAFETVRRLCHHLSILFSKGH